MNKWKGSTGAKIVAWVLIVISSFTFVGAAIAAIACQEAGVYNNTKEEALQSFYKTIAERYVYRAMQHRDTEQEDTDSNANYFENTNFLYGILKTSDTSLSDIDLNDEKNYEQRNFADKIEKGDYWEYDFDVTDSTNFTYGASFWDFNYFYTDDGEDNYRYIDKCVYEMQSGIFYYDSEGTYYPVKKVEIPIEGSDGKTITLELTYSKETQNYQAQVSYENYPTDEAPADELVKNIIQNGKVSLSELDGTALGYENWSDITLNGHVYSFQDGITPTYFSVSKSALLCDFGSVDILPVLLRGHPLPFPHIYR